MSKNKAKILIKNLAFPLVGIAGFLVVWGAAYIFYGMPFILPSPLSALRGAGRLLTEASFWRAFAGTFLRSLIAFLVSFGLALVLALFCAVFNTKQIFAAPIAVIRSVPTMVVISLFLLWTGSASATPVLIAVLVIFPTIYSSFTAGIEKTPLSAIESAKVYGANRAELIRFVYAPSLASNIVENIASGFSLTLKLIVSAEFMVWTRNSVGALIYYDRIHFRTDRVMAAALLVAVFCIIFEYSARFFIKSERA